MTQKLFRVTLRGMQHSAAGIVYGVSYVVAHDPNHAYQVVVKDLEKRDIGSRHERELEKVELISEDCEYPDCGVRLYA